MAANVMNRMKDQEIQNDIDQILGILLYLNVIFE